MKTKLLILFTLFFSFSLFAETLEVETITEALAYTGDKEAITKLVVTGTIAGNDYSDESEWSKFRKLDETFPNIEEVELLTEQDLLDADGYYGRSLFYRNDIEGANWLKRFSAPNTKYVGDNCFSVCANLEEFYLPSVVETGIQAFAYSGRLKYVDMPELVIFGYGSFQNCYGIEYINALKVIEIRDGSFYRCYSLQYADIPEVTTISASAFSICRNLVSIDLPKVKTFGYGVFSYCNSLTSVSLGTGFEEETFIEFGSNMFGPYFDGDTLTKNIELTLGEYVLPIPNGNLWQKVSKNPQHADYNVDYIWKSITIKYVTIEEEITSNNIFYIGNNTYKLENVEYAELYDLLGRKVITFENESVIDFNHYNLLTGLYLIRLIDNNKNFKTCKIIVN